MTNNCLLCFSFFYQYYAQNYYMSTESYWVLLIKLPLYLFYTLVALLFFKLLSGLIRNLILSTITKRSNSFLGYLRSVQYRRNKLYLLQNTFWDKFYILCMNTGGFFLSSTLEFSRHSTATSMCGILIPYKTLV